MLGYLILAILAGFIAVDIIRSRPKPQPTVTKKETFVCANCKRELSKEYLFTRGLCINCVMDSYKRNRPEPAIPTPEKVQKETFVCPNCKRELNKKYLYKQGMCVDCVASSAPGNMALEKEVKFEQRLGLRPGESFASMQERSEHIKRKTIEDYLKNNNFHNYMKETAKDQYAYRYVSDYFRYKPHTHVTIDGSIRLMDELYSSSKGQQLGVKPQYIETLKKFLQSNDNTSFDYLTALHYIYFHLLLETSPASNIKLKLSDDAELYKIFKDSIPKHIDYLKLFSEGEPDIHGYTSYEFAQKIDKMFCSISK